MSCVFAASYFYSQVVLIQVLVWSLTHWCRRQKQEKDILNAKGKKIGSHINVNAQKRSKLLEKAEHLVGLVAFFNSCFKFFCNDLLNCLFSIKYIWIFKGVRVQGNYKEMEDLKRQEESRQQRILKAKEDLAAAELELENMPPYETPKDEIVSCG